MSGTRITFRREANNMIINLDTICQVTLTDRGARHYNYWHYPLGKKAPFELREGHILKTPFWNIIGVFGGDSWHNDNPVFQNNQIKIINEPIN